jgi:hypothetical protein
LKGAIQLDKKQFTSWGVSFGSLALVAGMVSYLGLTNKNTTPASNKSTQTQATSPNPGQQAPFQNDDGQSTFGNSSTDSSSFGDDQGTNDDGSSLRFGNGSIDDNGQSSFDDGSSQSNQFSNRGSFGHHGRFDTTTGGT